MPEIPVKYLCPVLVLEGLKKNTDVRITTWADPKVEIYWKVFGGGNLYVRLLPYFRGYVEVGILHQKMKPLLGIINIQGDKSVVKIEQEKTVPIQIIEISRDKVKDLALTVEGWADLTRKILGANA